MEQRIADIPARQRPAPGPSPRTLRATEPPRSLYIHIPFCFHKCHYCDFYSIVDTQDRAERFTERLARELRAIAPWAQGLPLRTIFVGGGTPTLLPELVWRTLLETLHDAFDLSLMRPARDGEFTVECNPETATAPLMRTLAGGGVNRLSIGAQSFNKAHLATLERWHDPDAVPRALDLARDAGIQRLNLDLIHAIPGQTIESCIEDLRRALALGVEHISAYSLTYEPGTAMTARLERGEFRPADEQTDADMMLAIRDQLRAHGFRRYEISNYALPGAECRHNLAYWRQDPWLAAGPSASAHLAGHRWKNVPRLGDYLDLDDEGRPPVIDHETPHPRRALAERIMTGLRLSDGLDAHAVLAPAHAIGPDLPGALRAHAGRLRREGLLRPRSPARVDRWILTESGVLLADRVAAGFMAIVDP